MRIGFIGLGTMGASMALNIRARGFDVVVHDLRREAAAPHLQAGCDWSDSIEQLARGCDLVFTSLPGPKEVEAIALGDKGLLASMRAGTAWFDLSTGSPTLARRLHAAFAPKGISVFDAPVSGGPLGAKSGKLALWVGGDKALFDRYKPVLDAIGDQVFHIGAIGAGSVAKLVHNCAGYTIQTVLAEVFTLGVKAGVDPLSLWLAVRQGAFGRQRVFDRLPEQFLPQYFDPPSFTLRLAHKDVTLATELARELDVPMRLAGLAHADLTEALNRGWGALDSRIPMMLQVERAGVDTKVPREVLEPAVASAMAADAAAAAATAR